MDKILKIRLGRDVKDYLSITFGLMCYALGWAAFLLPYQITTGGVTGISAIIYLSLIHISEPTRLSSAASDVYKRQLV